MKTTSLNQKKLLKEMEAKDRDVKRLTKELEDALETHGPRSELYERLGEELCVALKTKTLLAVLVALAPNK